MRVRTGASATSCAGTQPVAPFGRCGSSTRYHVARQPLLRRPSTPSTIGTRFTFTVARRANGRWPGERNACVGRRTTAAHARRGDTSRSYPAGQLRRSVVRTPATPPARSGAAQPAATSAAAATAIVKGVLRLRNELVKRLQQTDPPADRLTTVRTMDEPIKMPRPRLHRHRAVTIHVVGQRGGVPYELERRVCETCGQELELRTLRRTAA
jgi:hypothetical protein